MTTYYWPSASNTSARGVNILPYGNTIAVPNWYTANPDLFYLSGGALVEVATTGLSEGFWASCAGSGSGDIWGATYSQSFVHFVPNESPTVFSLPSNPGIEGCAFVSGAPYVLTSSGIVYQFSGTAFTAVIGNFTTPCANLQGYEDTLYTILSGTSPAIGELTLSTATSGTVTQISSPIAVPVNLSISASGAIGIVGWDYSTLTSGYSAFATNPSLDSVIVALSKANNTISLYSSTSRNWSTSQVITASGSPAFVNWTTDGVYGEQVFVTDTTHGYVSIFDYTAGTLTLNQSFSLSGAASVSSTPNALMALVTQPSQNLVEAYQNSANGWATFQSISGIPDPLLVECVTDTFAAIAYGNGVAWLTYNSGTWSVTSSGVLNFVPTAITSDISGNVYVVGTSGTSGYLSVYESSSSFLGSQTWIGGAVDVLWQQGQVYIADNTSSLVRGFGLYGMPGIAGNYSEIASFSTDSGILALGEGYESIFVSNASSTQQCESGPPFQLVPTIVGKTSQYVSGTWTTTNLGIGERPQTAAFDASGNLWTTTQENTLYEISPAGAITSSTVIPPYGSGASAQKSGVPLGISSLIWFNTHLYGSSSLNGSMVELV